MAKRYIVKRYAQGWSRWSHHSRRGWRRTWRPPGSWSSWHLWRSSAPEYWRSLLRKQVDNKTTNYSEDAAENVQEVTNELVVVVLQLLLGVPAVAIVRSVSHLEVLELELKSYVLFPWLLDEHWASICTLLWIVYLKTDFLKSCHSDLCCIQQNICISLVKSVC